MKVVCPSCSAAYNIDDQRVPASGLKVRCPKCKHTFPVWRPGSEPAEALPLPAPAAAAPPPSGAVPLPPPPAPPPAAPAVLAPPPSEPFAPPPAVPLPSPDPFAAGGAVPLPPASAVITPLPRPGPASMPAAWPPLPASAEPPAAPLPAEPAEESVALPPPARPAPGAVPLPSPAAPVGAVALPAPSHDAPVPLPAAEAPAFVAPENRFGDLGARPPPRQPLPLPVPLPPPAEADDVPFVEGEPDSTEDSAFGESPFAAGPLPVPTPAPAPEASADPFAASADPFAAAAAPPSFAAQEPLPSAPEPVPLGFGEVDVAGPASRGGADPFSRPAPAGDIFDDLEAPPSPPAPRPVVRPAPSVPAEELESLLGADSPAAPVPAAAPAPAPARAPGAGFKVRRRSGKVFGPFPGDQIVDMLGKGELLGNEDVTDDGGASWAPIGTVAAFAEAMRALTATPEELAAPMAGRPPVAPAEGIPFGDRMAAARVTESEEPAPSKLAGLSRFSTRAKLVAAGAAAALVLAVGVGGAFTRYGWFFHKALRSSGDVARAATLVGRAKVALAIDDVASLREAAAVAGQAVQADDLSAPAKAELAAAVEALDRVHAAGPDQLAQARAAAARLAAAADGDALTLLAQAAVAGLEGGNASAAEGALERARWPSAPEPEALALLGARALERGDAPRAARFYQQLEAAQPGSPRAAVGLGRAAAMGGDPQAARAELEKALARAPGHPPARLELAVQAERSGNLAEARAKVDELLGPTMEGRLAPRERARALVISAGLYGRHAADANKAEEAYQAAIAADPRLPAARLAMAAHHLRRGDPARAVVALEPLQAGAAANPAVAELLIRGLAGAGRALDASTLAEAALAKSPDEPRLLMARGAAKELAGEREQATALYRKAMERAPDDVGPRVALARIALEVRQLDKAEAEVAVAVEKAPGDAAVQTALGDLRRLQGRADEAQQAYRAALHAEPEFAAAELGLARLAAASGDTEAARESLVRALAIEPRNARGHLELGTLLWQRGDLPGAERALSTAVSLAPNDALAHVRLGAIRLEQGDAAAGGKEIEAGSNLAPDLAEGHHWLGRALLARGETPSALSQLKRSVDMAPGNAPYLMHLAVAQERSNSLIDAVENYQAAIQADPKLLEAQERLGQLYGGNDRCDLAIPIYERALKLSPRLARLKLALADCRQRTGHGADAVRLYREVVEAEPEQTTVYYRLARAVHETRGLTAALPWYEKAAALDKLNPMPHLYLGFAYKERGAKAKAIQAFKAYLAIKPDAEDQADIAREIEYLGGTP